MEELFNVKADVSFKVSLAAAATLTIGDAQFFRLDYEVWKPTISFHIPLERD